MKKWSEIEKSILGKLFMSESEAKNQEYYDKFLILANEGLSEIANSVKPKIKEFKPITYKIMTKPYISNKIYIDSLLSGTWTISGDVEATINQNDGCVELLEPLTNNEELDIVRSDYAEDNVYKLKLTASSADECVLTINDSSAVYYTVKTPDDFLSFSDMINYFEEVEDPEIIYISDRKIKLTQDGQYTIFYNALYPEIDLDNSTPDDILDIDSSILQAVVLYVAYNVLSQDDIQRSMILKNQYELALSRLDTNIMYESKSFKSTGGWY